MAPQRLTINLQLEIYTQDTRGVFPPVDDIGGWMEVLVDWIDDSDGVPVCTDPDHACNQHISQMEDSEWRIASITRLPKEITT